CRRRHRIARGGAGDRYRNVISGTSHGPFDHRGAAGRGMSRRKASSPFCHLTMSFGGGPRVSWTVVSFQPPRVLSQKIAAVTHWGPSVVALWNRNSATFAVALTDPVSSSGR